MNFVIINTGVTCHTCHVSYSVMDIIINPTPNLVSDSIMRKSTLVFIIKGVKIMFKICTNIFKMQDWTSVFITKTKGAECEIG